MMKFAINYPIIWIKETFVHSTSSVISPIASIICVEGCTTLVKIVFAAFNVYLQSKMPTCEMILRVKL